MIGIDEVGRGAWAGPLLVVAARQTAEFPPGVADSKLLSPSQRQNLFNTLADCCQFGEGWVNPADIDLHGVADAMRIGVAKALEALQTKTDEQIVMDGLINYCPTEFKRVQCLAKADKTVALVGAASIWAKVSRDAYMHDAAQTYPGYGFETNVGYGTKSHKFGLQNQGPITGVHRFSYRPIKIYN